MMGWSSRDRVGKSDGEEKSTVFSVKVNQVEINIVLYITTASSERKITADEDLVHRNPQNANIERELA
jgi:hypothetical protein